MPDEPVVAPAQSPKNVEDSRTVTNPPSLGSLVTNITEREHGASVATPAKRPRGNPNFRKGVRPYTVPANKMPSQMGGPVPPKGLKRKLPAWNDVIKGFMEGKDKVGQKQRVVEVLQQAFNQAMDPRSPKQIAAIDFLVTRYAGRAKMAEEDSDTLKKAGITVVLTRPQLDPEIQHKALQPAPDFIDAEFTEEQK